MLTIIFSDNQPNLLYLTLESLSNIFYDFNNTVVFYNHLTPEVKKNYNFLKKKNNEAIQWKDCSDTVFKKEIVEFLNETPEKYVLFLSEGDIIFDNFSIKEIQNSMEKTENLCFSLRLGENVTFCNRLNVKNVIEPSYKDNVTIQWNWRKHYLDFGYPFSLNGHVFRTKEIKKLIKKIKFNNYMEMESSLQLFDNFPKELMSSFVNSKCLFFLNASKYFTNEDLKNRKEFFINYKQLKQTKVIEKEVNNNPQ